MCVCIYNNYVYQTHIIIVCIYLLYIFSKFNVVNEFYIHEFRGM